MEALASVFSIVYTYVLPVLLQHHLRAGMVYLILAALGLIPVLFIRSDSHSTCAQRYLSHLLQCPVGSLVQDEMLHLLGEKTPIVN